MKLVKDRIIEILTNNPSQTKKLGRDLAKKILKTKTKDRTLVIALEGDLGGGKTTFLQGFAKGLGAKEKILSPTFVILKRFKVQNSRFKNFYHIDCYRIKEPKEILDLHFKEIISKSQSIVAIEWADRIKKIIPKNAIWFRFQFVGQNKRRILMRSLGKKYFIEEL